MANKNQSNKRSYTFIALIVAALALISTVLFLITKGLSAIGMFSGATSDTLNRGLLLSAGFTILAFAIYVVLEPEKIRQAITGRQARYGSNALVMTIAFLGILIVGNVLTFQNPKRLDLTQDKSHTLAPETLKALQTLPASVSAVGFFSSTLPTDTATQLLNNFKASSNGRFSFKFVNPDTDPEKFY